MALKEIHTASIDDSWKCKFYQLVSDPKYGLDGFSRLDEPNRRKYIQLFKMSILGIPMTRNKWRLDKQVHLLEGDWNLGIYLQSTSPYEDNSKDIPYPQGDQDIAYLVFPELLVHFIHLTPEELNIPLNKDLPSLLQGIKTGKLENPLVELTRILFVSLANPSMDGLLGNIFKFLERSFVSDCKMSSSTCYCMPKISDNVQIWNEEDIKEYLGRTYDPMSPGTVQHVNPSYWKQLYQLVQSNVMYVPGSRSNSADLFVFFKEKKKMLAIKVKYGMTLKDLKVLKEEAAKVFVGDLDDIAITWMIVSPYVPYEVQKHSMYNGQVFNITGHNHFNITVPQNGEIIILAPVAFSNFFSTFVELN